MNRFLHICLVIFGLFVLCHHSTALAQSSDWVYSPYTQYLTNDTTIPPPVGEPADAALSCFRHDTIYVLVMPTGQLYIWLRPDPLMDKYIHLSPYAYCNGNPLKFVDPNGREITITGENGETVLYEPYCQYEGSDAFISEMWSYVDEIYRTKSGGIVLDELIADKGKKFNLTNNISIGPNGIETKGYVNGKRIFQMGGGNITSELLAHEFFHAYQDLYGYGGASCANDVEAYLFQGLVYAELYGGESFGMNTTFQLQPIDNQSMYSNTYVEILTDGMLNMDRLIDLAKGFSVYSRAGANGIAKNYTTFSKNQQYRILHFWRK